jgi:hypothetical protein
MFDLEKERAKIIARHYAEFPKEPTGATAPKGAGGPKTDAGKQRSSINAYKHGLTGHIHLVTADEHEAFEKHCQAVVEALAPVGILEQNLAQSIAADQWRLNRARAIETGVFAIGQSKLLVEPAQLPMMEAISQTQTWLTEGKNLQLVALYAQRIQRSMERNMAELRTLRAERKAALDQALEEAVLLAQLAKSKGEAYNAAADFPSPQFVYSTAEFETLIARKQRLDEARALPKTRQNANPGKQMPAAA